MTIEIKLNMNILVFEVTGIIREIMMGVGNRVATVIMLTFPSDPCPHADG